MAESCDKTADISAKNENNINSKHCFSINLSEVERDFKRLKVDESVKQSISKSKIDNSVNNCNYFSYKSSPYLSKMSCPEKRQSMSGFRRQRLHTLSSNIVRTNSSTAVRSRSTEGFECVAKDCKDIRKDFNEIKLNSKTESTESTESHEYSYFHKDFELESNEWRNNWVKSEPKKTENSDKTLNCKPKTNRIRKLRFKEEKSCARQAMCDPNLNCDASVDELAAYFDDNLYLPKKMSFMAEMMYT